MKPRPSKYFPPSYPPKKMRSNAIERFPAALSRREEKIGNQMFKGTVFSLYGSGASAAAALHLSLSHPSKSHTITLLISLAAMGLAHGAGVHIREVKDTAQLKAWAKNLATRMLHREQHRNEDFQNFLGSHEWVGVNGSGIVVGFRTEKEAKEYGVVPLRTFDILMDTHTRPSDGKAYPRMDARKRKAKWFLWKKKLSRL